MIGKYSGAVARIKTNNSETVAIHCFLHGHALVIKRMPPDLVEVLEDVTKIVNFIKARPLNSKMFKVLCEDMGKTHKVLYIKYWQDFMSCMKNFTVFYLIKSTHLRLN